MSDQPFSNIYPYISNQKDSASAKTHPLLKAFDYVANHKLSPAH